MATRSFLAIMLLMLAVPIGPTNAQTADEEASCPDGLRPEDVPGQGPSCRVPGGWLLRLRDGTRILTHGPDEIPADSRGSIVMPSPVAPRCVDPATQPHAYALYARPIDRPDRYAEVAPQIREMVAKANALLGLESQALGPRAEYKFRCQDGAIVVASALLATPSAATTYYSIAQELHDQGFTDPLAKYWVWHDGSATDQVIAGQASIEDDDRLVPDNANMAGATYAITYTQFGDWGASVMMHEAGHNLGAVQLSAPHTSGGWHCNDGKDVMCYGDGGSESAYTEDACADRFYWDCGHDDYFHPSPAPDNFLASHWNLGSPFNKYFSFNGKSGGDPPPPPPARCAWDLQDGGVGWIALGLVHSYMDYAVPPACRAQPFLLEATSHGADFDVDWFQGSRPLRSDRHRGPESGAVPLGADNAHIFPSQGLMPTFRLRAGDSLNG